jgi:UDP-galactopyranose mutase
VGAGLSGATIARRLAEEGWSVDLLERRNHVAGNAYDYVDPLGFRIHKYGPHIFHTNSEKVVNWLSRFTKWTPYKHRVKAILDDGSYVPFPPNRKTLNLVDESAIVDTFYRPYTRKMWGLEIEEIDPRIVDRVPIRDDYEDLYFPNDKFQMLPEKGYTRMVENMLAHRNIKVMLNHSFVHGMEANYLHTFNSMPIDQYFHFCYGELPYRSIKFHHTALPASHVFPTAVVNFTHGGKHTRITEWCHFPGHGIRDDWTALTFEEPCDYRENDFERYYPVKDIKGANRALYRSYKKLVPENMTFIGRCGKYVYLDMHQAVSSALSDVARFIRSSLP